MLTIGGFIGHVLDLTPGGRREHTVDTVKAGDISQPLRAVVTTCMCTVAVIRRAIDLGANLIITHEPTYYKHEDETDWLADDAVYGAKRWLLDEHGIVVWRYHDHIHSLQPDGIVSGLVSLLGWDAYASPDKRICVLPPTPLQEIARYVAALLGSAPARVVGDPHMVCSRVGLAVGASGGQRQIGFLRSERLDLIICGEINEWELAEYVRDSNLLGQPLGLAVVGHIDSEEPGMAWLAGWLAGLYPDLPVTHVPASSPFVY